MSGSNVKAHFNLEDKLWKVNADNSSLTQVFNYLDLSSDVFGRDGTEYKRNTAFADGFDITGDGSSVLIPQSVLFSRMCRTCAEAFLTAQCDRAGFQQITKKSPAGGCFIAGDIEFISDHIDCPTGRH